MTETDKSLAVVEERAPVAAVATLEPAEFEMFKAIAAAAHLSTLASQWGRDRGDAIVGMIMGHAIGLHPGVILAKCRMVEGNLWIPSDIQLGLVCSRIPDFRYEVVENSATRCALKAWRGNRPAVQVEYTMEQAQRTGRVKAGSAYLTYPEDKLFAMTMRRALQRVAPDALYGLATMLADDPDEPEPRPNGSAAAEVEETIKTAASIEVGNEVATQTTNLGAWKDAYLMGMKRRGFGGNEAFRKVTSEIALARKLQLPKSAAQLSEDDWQELHAGLEERYHDDGTPRSGAVEVAATEPQGESNGQGSATERPVAADQEPPPAVGGAMPIDALAIAREAACSRGDREAFVVVCRDAEKQTKEQYLADSGGRLGFIQGDILIANGLTLSNGGAKSQWVDQLSNSAIMRLAKEVVERVLKSQPASRR